MKILTLRNKIGYLSGDFGNVMSFSMSASFLLAFYVDVVGLSAAAIGTLFLVARIWDGFNDPIMGTFAEKRFSRLNDPTADKFRPYLLKGSFLVATFAILMFWVPESLSMNQKLAWAYLTYICWGMSYTFLNIPYGSIATCMTQDAEERASLSAFRTLGAVLGGAFLKFVIPAVLVMFADDLATGYLLAMIGCAVIGMCAHIFAYTSVTENIKSHDTSPPIPVAQQMKALLNNTPLLCVSLSAFLCLLAIFTVGSTMIFWLTHNMDGALWIMSLTGIIDIVVMLCIARYLPKLVGRYGVRTLMVSSGAISFVVCILGYFFANTAEVYLAIYIIEKIVWMAPLAHMWAQVSDCVEYNQYLTGKRQEGVIYASFSLMRKIGGAGAGFFAALGIGLIGYDGSLAVQTEETKAGLQIMMFIVPAILFGLMAILYKYLWILTPERREEVIQHNQALLNT